MTIYHKHHIIPKHMGGSDDPSNLIELTIEEHAEAHRKLFEQHGRWQDELAWKALLGIVPCADAIREAQSRANKGKSPSIDHRKKLSEAITGIKRSQKTREKMKRAALLRSRNYSTKTKIKMSEQMSGANNPHFGKTHSEEARKKMSDARKKYLARKRQQI